MKIVNKIQNTFTQRLSAQDVQENKNRNRFCLFFNAVKNSLIKEKIKFNSNGYQKSKVFSSNLHTLTGKIDQTGFVSNFRNTGEPGLLIHGYRDPETQKVFFVYNKGSYFNNMDTNNQPMRSGNLYLTAKEFVSHLKENHNIDLSVSGNTGKNNIHLVCCYSGSLSEDSLATELANEINRTVISYGQGKPVSVASSRNHLIKDAMSEEFNILTSSKGVHNSYSSLESIHRPGQKVEIKAISISTKNFTIPRAIYSKN
ncbi:hypothetical protein [Symbiopectobacterium purcellii]|uniref:hypothetical protein n=1 Tax=Symbiopectobacterium purcellii TaxID=2871826 RepID=UPI003F86D42B